MPDNPGPPTEDQLAPSSEQKRKNSTSSIDSRMVAAELESERSDDLFGIVEDVRPLLGRKEGLPAYISRQHIFEAFSQILTTSKVDPAKKVDVLNLSVLLINDLLQGPKKPKKSEIKSALGALLPAAIQQLPVQDQTVQQASVKVLQKCLDKANSPTVEFLLVDHLVESGINSRKDGVSIETMKLLPGIFLPDNLDETDVGPIIEALYTQLSKTSREQFAFSALLRHREAMDDAEYQGYTDKVSKSQKNLFKMLSQSYENKDFHLAKKPPKDGVSFGMIPNVIINRLLEKHNRNGRADGALLLRRELENSKEEKFGQLLPYVGSFIKFLGELLADNNPKVTLHILECHDVLLANAPQAMRQYTAAVVTNLLGISLDSKLQIKIEIFRLIRELMMVSTPAVVIAIMQPQLDHKNGKMREDIINFIIFALLTFPSDSFDLDAMVKMMAPLFLDPKRRVRQACLESLAIMSQIMGPAKIKVLYETVTQMDTGHYDTAEDIINAISCRLARKLLPRITEDGYVEYGLQIPYNIYTRTAHTPKPGKRGGAKPQAPTQDADIDWVLRGTGSLSRGSAGSVSLGVGGLGSNMGPYGSMVSLRSARSMDDSGPRSGRSRSVSSAPDDWNKHSKIPDIKTDKGSEYDSDLESSLSRQTSTVNQYDDDDDDDQNGQVVPDGFDDNDGPGDDHGLVEDDLLDPDDGGDPVDEVDPEPRVLSPGAIQQRTKAYGTISRSQSELDLRQAAMTPPPGGNTQKKMSLVPVTEEDNEDDRSPTPTPDATSKDKTPKGFLPKKVSLADMGLATFNYKTQFDAIDEENQDGDAPGAFKRPKSAFTLAKADLKSNDWESEIEGLEALVRLVRWHKEVVLPEIDGVLLDLCNETKNLRSQVTRAAQQAFIKLFVNLGKDMDGAKNMETTVLVLIVKAADTNRFIRADANAALDAMSENVTIFKAVGALSRNGLSQKHVAARASAGRVIANMVDKIGAANLLDGYPDAKDIRETTDLVMKTASTLLADGSLDTRMEAKKIFSILIHHEKFDVALKNSVENSIQLEKIKKSIEGMKQQKI